MSTKRGRGRRWFLEHPIVQFSIVEQSGIIIYHKGFKKDIVDEILFSGFSAAIIVFSRELGTELYSIQMSDINFFFKDSGSYFFVCGFDPKVWKRDIKKFLNELEEDIKEIDLDQLLEKGVFFIPEEYQSVILQRINELQIKYR